MRSIEQLVKQFAFFIAILRGERIPVMFEQEQVTKNGNWTAPAAKRNISDVTFTNLSTTGTGTVYVNNIPIAYGQSIAYGCQWNEVNLTQYTLRFEGGADLCVIDYKTFHQKPEQK